MTQEGFQAPSTCSVVVAGASNVVELRRCLRSLAEQSIKMEIVVATALAPEDIRTIEREFPSAKMAPVPAEADIFRLRTLGVEQSTGAWVALTEAHCTFAPDWLSRLLAAAENCSGFVGGAMVNGMSHSRSASALYWFEYGALRPATTEDAAARLSGVNALYSRRDLDRCRDVWGNGFYENEVHGRLIANGVRPQFAPRAVVTSHLHWPLSAAISHLYAGGRRFGRHRTVGKRWVHRAFWTLASVAVPAVLLSRFFRRSVAGSGSFLRPIGELPSLLLWVLAWSAGETVGYLRAARAGE